VRTVCARGRRTLPAFGARTVTFAEEPWARADALGLAVVMLSVAGMIWAEEQHSAKLFHAIGSPMAKRSVAKVS
jgi:hypothetical protein